MSCFASNHHVKTHKDFVVAALDVAPVLGEARGLVFAFAFVGLTAVMAFVRLVPVASCFAVLSAGFVVAKFAAVSAYLLGIAFGLNIAGGNRLVAA